MRNTCSLLFLKAYAVEDRGESLVVVAVSGLRRDADEVVQAFRPQNSDDPIGFQAAGRRVVGQISGKTRLAVQAYALALTLDFHLRIRFLQILQDLARPVFQRIRIVCISLGLRDAYDQPVSQCSMAAPIVQDAALRREGNSAAVAIRILLPVVRILDGVRIRLILSKIAGGRRGGGPGRSG